MSASKETFTPEITAKLRYYVYRLIDPRNGETFYVGKGKGNRVFAHIELASSLEGDDVDNKVRRIREIQLAGFEVAHVIHRHGMDEKTAFEVECALMDAYPGLTNAVGGVHGSDFGAMHAREIIRRYSAKPAVFVHKALLISVNKSAVERSLYEATRFAWRLNVSKARQAEVVLATLQGLIVGAFLAHEWLPATRDNFPALPEDNPKRWGFVGREATAEIKQAYVGRRLPEGMRKRGNANPILYSW